MADGLTSMFQPVVAPSVALAKTPRAFLITSFPSSHRSRPAQITARFRQRLPHPRWHRHSRLPCYGSGGSPGDGASPEVDTGKNFILNLGTGQGLSVLEVVKGFDGYQYQHSLRDCRAASVTCPLEACPKPPLNRQLDCQAILADMCRDNWAYQQSANPQGYARDPHHPTGAGRGGHSHALLLRHWAMRRNDQRFDHPCKSLRAPSTRHGAGNDR